MSQGHEDATSAQAAWVVRAGLATPRQLQAGVAEHRRRPGLFGFSVQHSPGLTVEQLAAAGQFPHGQISVTTVERLIAAGIAVGYDVRVVGSPGVGFHHTVVVPYPLPDELATALSLTFLPRQNPARFTG
jgi:hypothetical protein